MSRRHHYRRRAKEQADLDMTTFLNLMVVLVPFLLNTAVIRRNGLEVANGRSVIATLPMVEGQYDLDRLSELVMSLKRTYPDKNDASVLLEPDIEYDHLIQVMDAVRSTTTTTATGTDDEQRSRLALFTDISIGDAP